MQDEYEGPKYATVSIELRVDMENFAIFLQDWSATRDKLIELAGIVSAEIRLPDGVQTIPLEKF